MATIFETVEDLGKIITDAITAGNDDNIPPRVIRNTLVRVSTGVYREVLPIIVPAECCVIGDELRSTRVEPRTTTNGTLTPKSDFAYSYNSLNRIADIVDDVVTGVSVTPTQGNTVLQDQSWPYAESGNVGPQVKKLARGIHRQIDAALGTKQEAILPPAHDLADPNLGKGIDLNYLNLDFIQAEVIAYIGDQYPALQYSRTKCKQDVKFIMDALAYDISYGGTWQSVNAGLAYYSGREGVLQIDASEKTATLAAYDRLAELLRTVSRDVEVTPVYQLTVPQVRGNGSLTTDIIDEVNDRITIIKNIIDNGPDTAPAIIYPDVSSASIAAQDASEALFNAKEDIQTKTIDFINENFGTFKYNSTKCRRDLGYIITDTSYDVALGTNYNAVFTGLAYQRPNNAYNLNQQRKETIGSIRKARDLLKESVTSDGSTAVGSSNASDRIDTAYNEIVDIIRNGSIGTAEPGDGVVNALVFPNPAGVDQNKIDAKQNLIDNRAFIQEDVVAYVNQNYDSLVYSEEKCRRDAGHIVDALVYDILYGTNHASVRIARSYFTNDNIMVSGQETETIAAYEHLKSVAQDIILENTVTAQTGNNEIQTKNASPASATESTELGTLMDITIDVLTAGNLNSLPAINYPDTSWASAEYQTAFSDIASDKDTVIKETIQFITDTYNTFTYDHAKCSRDIGLIIDAARYDWLLGTNYASFVAGLSYLRQPSEKVTGDQKVATIAANEYSRSLALQNVNNNDIATAGVNTTWDIVDDHIHFGSGDGSNDGVDDQEVYNAIRMLELNKDFIVQEALSSTDNEFKRSVTETKSSNNTLVISDTSWLSLNMPIKFVEPDDSTNSLENSGLQDAATYYVQEIISDTEFKVNETPGGFTSILEDQQSGFVYGKDKCRRDTGIILDAVGYDIALGTNYNAVTSGLAYRRANSDYLLGNQIDQTVDAINYTRDIVNGLYNVKNSVTALARSTSAFNEITDILQNGVANADTLTFPAPSDATTDTQNAVAQLIANRAFLQAEVIQYITDNYPGLTYDSAKCSRDVGYLVDALCYDIMYGGNSASVRAAESYFVGAASQLGAGQQAATVAAYDYLASAAGFVITETTSDAGTGFPLQVGVSQNVAGTAATATEATLAADLLQITEDVIAAGNLDDLTTETYPSVAWADDALESARTDIVINKTEITNKTIRYIDDTYAKMFEVRSAYEYNRQLCARDVREYVDAMINDLTYPSQWKRSYSIEGVDNSITFYRPGAYATRLAARYYANSVIGSQEEDFYYLRNGTGLRLQTLDGLKGDLGAPNEFGTQRPTAGAYASLDPGWGPDDQRVWITARSPYVQNVSTFGYAATGQKIDGALHNGGNDSMVSNDFTQVISDGIGAWITNNGRAELVSVFTYYSHVGYLAENGGRIRGTNGNNSYGAYGGVAEGVDPEEIPVTGIVDNRTQYNATVANVFTDNAQILACEFSHAGNEYTEAGFRFFGPGDNEDVLGDEFRDGAVVQGRVIETDPDNNPAGGSGYLVVSNTAQAGDTSSVTLSATDGNLSTAYPGMKLYITGGAGIGQFGIVDTYNAGTKVANVLRESDGQAGWDHVVPGTTIVAPNSTSTYEIEPRVQFSAPTRSSTSHSIASGTYSDLHYFETSAQYIGVATTTESDGSGATFDVTRNGEKYYLTLNQAGIEYQRLDVLTIPGTSVGGATPLNDIAITITTLNEETGAVIDYDFTGIGQKGSFIALPGTVGSTAAQTSVDGQTWSSLTLPNPGGANTYSDIASGLVDDGSSTFKQSFAVAVGQGYQNAAYSTDGVTWNEGTLPGTFATAGATSIAFGQITVNTGRFVAISANDSDVVYSDNGGASWQSVASPLTGTGYNSLTFGKGLFVALRANTTDTMYSEDGITWAGGSGLPNANWVDLTWGNGRFVAIASNGIAAYSLDGKNWTQNNLPDQGTRTYRKIAYGQGVFTATRDDANVVYSQDGLNWLPLAITTGTNTIAFGNPGRVGKFVTIDEGTTTVVNDCRIGAQAFARASVANEQVFAIRLTEPGSGYTSDPTITITDPNNIKDVEIDVRLGDGAVANPTYINRGTGFTSASAEVDDQTSNGFADFFQDGSFIAVRRLTKRPVPGSNVVFDSLPGQYFKLVNTVSLRGTNDGSYTGFLQISPTMSISDAPVNGDDVTMRIRFSQVRLTGHDFLDIGTGNFEDTNYPNTPVNNPDADRETNNFNGGRVFFTATDQDGNFRVGDLFSIEQATGVATLNADAFNIAGLQELSLGEVTLGGNSASINEFSTDPFFTANSDTVVPTQRAIKAYIEAQIGGGGASLNVNSVTAGDIFIGGNQITTVTGAPINIKANVNFTGTVLGLPLAYNYFLR